MSRFMNSESECVLFMQVPRGSEVMGRENERLGTHDLLYDMKVARGEIA